MADIHSKVPTEDYRSNFDRIFGKGVEKHDSEPAQDQVPEHELLPVFDQETCLLFGHLGEDKVQFTRKGEVLLEISNRAFYVRGKQVEQDANEAAAVYKAFKEFVGLTDYGLSEVPNVE